jgi:hypothetical protein
MKIPRNTRHANEESKQQLHSLQMMRAINLGSIQQSAVAILGTL